MQSADIWHGVAWHQNDMTQLESRTAYAQVRRKWQVLRPPPSSRIA